MSRYPGKVRCWTARHWPKKLGFFWRKVQKGVYVDEYGLLDVRYWQEVFVPVFNEIRPVFVSWDEKEKMTVPQNLPLGQKPGPCFS